MENVMFKVGNTDYSNHVISGTYQVQNVELYVAWTDGNYVEHRHKTREQMQGTFDVFFKTIDEYKAFCADVKANKKLDLSVPCVLFDNMTDTEKTCDCFVEFQPTRRRNDMWQDEIEVFEVKVKEK